jgi:hypothetical protein
MEEEKRRYVGLDIVGKRTYAMAVIGKNGKVSHSNGRTDSEGRAALYGKLSVGDKVALEAGELGVHHGLGDHQAGRLCGSRAERGEAGVDLRVDEEDG